MTVREYYDLHERVVKIHTIPQIDDGLVVLALRDSEYEYVRRDPALIDHVAWSARLVLYSDGSREWDSGCTRAGRAAIEDWIEEAEEEEEEYHQWSTIHINPCDECGIPGTWSFYRENDRERYEVTDGTVCTHDRDRYLCDDCGHDWIAAPPSPAG